MTETTASVPDSKIATVPSSVVNGPVALLVVVRKRQPAARTARRRRRGRPAAPTGSSASSVPARLPQTKLAPRHSATSYPSRRQLGLRRVPEPERDELVEPAQPRRARRLRRGTRARSRSPRRGSRTRARAAAQARRGRRRCRARASSGPSRSRSPEEPQLVLGRRVLELVIALRDGEVARDHARKFI